MTKRKRNTRAMRRRAKKRALLFKTKSNHMVSTPQNTQPPLPVVIVDDDRSFEIRNGIFGSATDSILSSKPGSRLFPPAPEEVTASVFAPSVIVTPPPIPVPKPVPKPVPVPVPSPWANIDVHEYPFSIDISLEKIRQKIKKRLSGLVTWLEELEEDGKPLPMPYRKENSGRVFEVTPEEMAENPNIWFLGDIHGDLLALISTLKAIDKLSDEKHLPPPRIVLLGDIVDRLKYSFETFFWVLCYICKDRADSIVWLAGNHDEIQASDGENPQFFPSTNPSEFCECLNNPPADSPWTQEEQVQIRRLVQLYAHQSKKLPVAIWFPSEILAAHGGVPHVDVLDKIQTWEDLSQPQMAQDFMWLRLTKMKRKIPSRMSRSCQMGYLDFEDFAEKMKKMNHPVQCFIRGHDHFPERFVPMPKYTKIPVYTINTVSCIEDGAPLSDDFCTPPAVIQFDANAKKLTAWRIVLNPEQVKNWYATPPQQPENVTPDP